MPDTTEDFPRRVGLANAYMLGWRPPEGSPAMPDTPFSVQLSYMTRTEPLTEETLVYLVRTESEHAAHIDALTAALRDAQSALRDAAEWIEAEVEHPRSDPHPAMRRQAEVLRAILGEPHDA